MRTPSPRPSLVAGAWLAADLLSVAVPGTAAAQCPARATIDTVIVETAAPWDAAAGGADLPGRVAAALHVRTRPGIIRRTVLLRPGD
jgi:hypothetical protein